ncbi:hypothetical protein AB5J62_27480 [Amycolatopsis sp. cg5]|uniref:hypothetical protein n=1 Tax=Amycolatopsis sp. cg5 TaxID=3238802 RepID=UPI00352547EF
MAVRWWWVAGLLMLTPLASCAQPQGNPAQVAVSPVLTELAPLHPVIECTSGESADDMPWHQVYLTMALNPDPEPALRRAAARFRYQLEPDTETIANLKNLPDATHFWHYPTGDDEFHPTWSYLRGATHGRTLGMVIARDGNFNAACQDGTRSEPVPLGKALVMLSMAFPKRP